ncbi:unnamed protein product [Blepharisma stoltei]|uniref:Cytochrome P450 n=1 Tax=Blepharisma stoltei TaxID=1481888 RepID=A0AAU9KD01_9CILI|nr:unnamed protein product [Blepharisma stoltei]
MHPKPLLSLFNFIGLIVHNNILKELLRLTPNIEEHWPISELKKLSYLNSESKEPINFNFKIFCYWTWEEI